MFGRASGLLRAGSVAAPGRTRSRTPDAEVYASPGTNHGSANLLVLNVGATNRLSGHRLGGHFLEDPEQHSVRGT